MTRKYLTILDVDRTLIDTNYRSTSPTIGSVIKQMNQEGHVFVINSNRSLQDLLPIAEHFGLDGEIIGENGCFIYDQKSQVLTVLANNEDIIAINDLKSILANLINENFSDSYFFSGDTSDLQNQIELESISEDLENLFILNQHRKYSISLHVRKIVNGEIEKDLETTRKLHNLISRYVAMQRYNLNVDFTNSYCNVLINPKLNNKSTGFKSMGPKYEDHLKVIIGDDYSDKPLMDNIDYFCVVNNATNEVKAVADYISPESITKGVEEILLNLDKITQFS